MSVETLGGALSYGWRVTARCAAGKQDGMHRHKECTYRTELDMETLVWPRQGLPAIAAGSASAVPHVRVARCGAVDYDPEGEAKCFCSGKALACG